MSVVQIYYRKGCAEKRMSFGDYDDFYEICCQSCISLDDRGESTVLNHLKTGKQMETVTLFQQELSEDYLYEKV